MPIKMIATDRYYDKDAGKEYKKGDSFTVADEAMADRIERRKRAKRAAPEVAKPNPPPRTRAMRAEQSAPATETITPSSTEDHAPLVQPATPSGRYRRSDFRSED